MFILANLFIALSRVCDAGLTIFYWLIIIRALLSWVNPDPFNPIVQFLERITEPALAPIRRFLPRMAIDISPIIAFLILLFLKSFLVQTLLDIGIAMR
jgi:YggT family protein